MHASLVRAQVAGQPRTTAGTDLQDVRSGAVCGCVARSSAPRDNARGSTRGGEGAVSRDPRWPSLTISPGSERSPSRRRPRGHLTKSALDELETGILAETDYVREADNTERFRAGLRSLGFVAVPEILREYSSDRVLTMTPVKGRHISEFLADRPSQKTKDRVGARLIELYYFQLLQLHAIHADPHWGNYLFTNDGEIGLVDFGCVKYLDDAFVTNMQSVFLYKGDHHSAEFQRLLEQRYAGMGAKLQPAVRRALTAFASGFYRKVYPGDGGRPPAPVRFRRPGLSARVLPRLRSALQKQRHPARIHLHGPR